MKIDALTFGNGLRDELKEIMGNDELLIEQVSNIVIRALKRCEVEE